MTFLIGICLLAGLVYLSCKDADDARKEKLYGTKNR